MFAHTEYDFADRNVGFEVFRFEDGQAVEHWDNIQSRMGPNSAGHSMTDGPTQAIDLNHTESNRQLVRSFINDVFLVRRLEMLDGYVDRDSYTEHSPRLSPNAEDRFEHLFARSYETIHRVLAEGNFVLCICEGRLDETHSSFYDLFRVDDSKIVEHWDTVDAVPPRSEWNNNNGKF